MLLQLLLTGLVIWLFRRFYRTPISINLSGSTILITGGGRGIGRHLCQLLADKKALVIAVDIDGTTLAETKKLVDDAGGKIMTFECDISNYDMVKKLLEHIDSNVGPIDILVNNAGIVRKSSILDPEFIKNHSTVFNVNINGTLNVIHSALPSMVSRGSGHIVNISSITDTQTVNQMSSYCASKAALTNVTETLRHELIAAGHHGIHITCVRPWLIDTGMFGGITLQPLIQRLIPPLNPLWTAQQIVGAIERRDPHLVLPRLFEFLLPFWHLMPQVLINAICLYGGMYETMSNFTGRRGSTAGAPLSSRDSK